MTELKTDHIGLSDADVEAEIDALRLDHEAYRLLERAIEALRIASTRSELRHQELLMYADALKDAMADYSISTQDWRAALSRAKDGW